MKLRIATCHPLPEADPDEALLLDALRARDVDARMVAWNDPSEPWGEPVPTLIRSTWDYVHALVDFRAWIARASSSAPLWNPRALVEPNLHKRYLLELERAGVPVVPTELVPRGTRVDLGDLLARRKWSDVVIKPAVGAASFATRRYRAGELERAAFDFMEAVRTRDVLVQPYLPSVESHGERALVWIDGAFTHAVRKAPRFADGQESVSAAVAIAPAERELAGRALAATLRDAGPDADLLCARVDVAPAPSDGAPCVMELELVEPSLFLLQSPAALERLADAVARRLSALRGRAIAAT